MKRLKSVISNVAGKAKWYIAHSVPRTHWTTYKENGKRYFHIWRQWFGKCWNQVKFEVKE